jgi:hypothetical protein
MIEPTKTAQRVRLAADVDLTKADPLHDRCGGTGIVGYQKVDDPTSADSVQMAPVICRCVSRSGGVKRDILDRMADQMQQQLADDTFGEQLASDLKLLLPNEMARKVVELTKKAADEGTDTRLKRQIEAALKTLKEEA